MRRARQMIGARRSLLPLASAALLLALVGCSSAEPVTLGEGAIPGSVPDDFPVPVGAEVGATRVDRVGHRTEFTLTVPRTVSSVAQYYLVGLVSTGYVVADYAGDSTSWNIVFSRDSLRGTVRIEPDGSGATAVVVSVNRS